MSPHSTGDSFYNIKQRNRILLRFECLNIIMNLSFTFWTDKITAIWWKVTHRPVQQQQVLERILCSFLAFSVTLAQLICFSQIKSIAAQGRCKPAVVILQEAQYFRYTHTRQIQVFHSRKAHTTDVYYKPFQKSDHICQSKPLDRCIHAAPSDIPLKIRVHT